jgi:hypothetical protein
MKIGSAFGHYLKKEHIGDRRVAVVIRDVIVEEIDGDGGKEKKPVVYFEGKDLGLVLNRTNADSITAILGTDETEHWLGKRIGLWVDPSVMYAGKRIGGIRIANASTGAKQAAPVFTPPPVEDFADDFQASDDDVPF